MRRHVFHRARVQPTSPSVEETFLQDFADAPDSFPLDDDRVKHMVKCDHWFPRLLLLGSESAGRKMYGPRAGQALVADNGGGRLAAGISRSLDSGIKRC